MTLQRLAMALTAALITSVATLGAQGAPRVLTLGNAARLASEQSGATIIARLHSKEMDAKTESSRAALLPSAAAGLSDGQRSFNTASFGIPFPGFDPNGSIIGPVRTVNVAPTLPAPIWNPGARSEYRNSQAAASRADADAAAIADGAMGAASIAYVRAARAEAQVAARAADSSLAIELVDIAKSELDAGVGVALNVSRAQVQLAKVRSQLSIARNERDRARLDLLRAVGLPLTTPIVLRDSLAMTAAPDTVVTADAAITQALDHRADLRAAATAVTVTAGALRAVQGERMPTVGVFMDEGLTSAGYAHLKSTYNYGIGVSVPLFEGHRNEARFDERSAVLGAAEARQRDLEADIAVDVRTALLDLASAREQTSASSDGLGFANQALAQARDRFRAGVTGSADAISAQLDVSIARGLLIDALAALQSAHIALARAQGRLSELP